MFLEKGFKTVLLTRLNNFRIVRQQLVPYLIDSHLVKNLNSSRNWLTFALHPKNRLIHGLFVFDQSRNRNKLLIPKYLNESLSDLKFKSFLMKNWQDRSVDQGQYSSRKDVLRSEQRCKRLRFLIVVRHNQKKSKYAVLLLLEERSPLSQCKKKQRTYIFDDGMLKTKSDAFEETCVIHFVIFATSFLHVFHNFKHFVSYTIELFSKVHFYFG